MSSHGSGKTILHLFCSRVMVWGFLLICFEQLGFPWCILLPHSQQLKLNLCMRRSRCICAIIHLRTYILLMHTVNGEVHFGLVHKLYLSYVNKEGFYCKFQQTKSPSLHFSISVGQAPGKANGCSIVVVKGSGPLTGKPSLIQRWICHEWQLSLNPRLEAVGLHSPD